MKSRLIASAILVVCAGTLQAGMIEIQPARSSEASIPEILSSYYGGDFTASGNDLIGSGPASGITAYRYDDFLTPTGVLDLGGSMGVGDATDAFMSGDLLEISAIAKYAGWTQRLGIDRGNGTEWLFTETGRGMAPASTATIDLNGDVFSWVRDSGNGSNTSYSDVSRNSDDLDHFVAYRIDGYDDVPTWIIGVEDKMGSGSDRDFNDLVFEVRAVPEPAALAVMAMGAVALIRRKK